MKRTYYLGLIAFTTVGLLSCGGDETTTITDETVTDEVFVEPCPESCDLTVTYDTQSRGSDTSTFVYDGSFDVVQTSIVYFHDSTMVLRIDNYEGRRESADDIELYVSLYTRNGEVLGEGEYGVDIKESRNSGLLIYPGKGGMLVSPSHLLEGSITITSYSKEKVCGNMNISMNDEAGTYGSIAASGDFIVEK
ncbi:MAG: hypothetical protein ACI857_001414 [Arenicella sp.]|jgi:hypothetical protein